MATIVIFYNKKGRKIITHIIDGVRYISKDVSKANNGMLITTFNYLLEDGYRGTIEKRSYEEHYMETPISTETNVQVL